MKNILIIALIIGLVAVAGFSIAAPQNQNTTSHPTLTQQVHTGTLKGHDGAKVNTKGGLYTPT